MAQAIQHKGETVANSGKARSGSLSAPRSSGMGYLTSTLYMSDELHPNAAGSLRHATYDAECLRQTVRRGLFDA